MQIFRKFEGMANNFHLCPHFFSPGHAHGPRTQQMLDCMHSCTLFGFLMARIRKTFVRVREASKCCPLISKKRLDRASYCLPDWFVEAREI